jgi:hypothetical protein
VGITVHVTSSAVLLCTLTALGFLFLLYLKTNTNISAVIKTRKKTDIIIENRKTPSTDSTKLDAPPDI